MIKKISALVLSLLLLLAASLCSGCSPEQDYGPEQPVTLTIWHVYGGQTDSPLNDFIKEFNNTVGKEQGIHVEVTMVTNTNTIHEHVLASANGDPGASALPDIFCSYPKTVLALPDQDILVDFNDYFSKDELDRFNDSFLSEGSVNGRQYVLPVAKSTEIMFVNKTLFDRFSAATGAKLSDLSTWEGLFRIASNYAAWTDNQTPDVSGDGKPFFVHDYHFNYFQVGVESLGGSFFNQDGQGIDFSPAFLRAWEPYARAAVKGGLWLKDGYATEPLRTGDSVVSVASSASILYYSDEVTYGDNTSEDVEFIALPIPVFKEGSALVMQRGTGLCLTKSTTAREKAAVTFLKWLTEPETNTAFAVEAGYMPVTDEAFSSYLPAAIKDLSDPKYISLYEAFLDTYDKYTFYHAPQLDRYLELETSFEKNVRLCLAAARSRYAASDAEDMDALITESLKEFKETMED